MKLIYNIAILLAWMHVYSKGVPGLEQFSLPTVKYLTGPAVGEDAIYYGYALAIDNSTENVSLLIGAPSSELGNMSLGIGGQIFFCTDGIDFSNGSGSTNCTSSITYIPPQSGGDLGVVLEASPTGTVMGCSPSAPEPCGSLVILPGYCSAFDINNGSSSILRTENLKACRSANVDVIFVLDGSGSLDTEEFGIIKDFTKGIVNLLEGIDSGVIRIGIFEFSNNPSEKIHLNNMLNRTELAIMITAIQAAQAGTNSGRALRAAFDRFQRVPKRTPSDARVLIFLTDGGADDETRTIAQTIRDSGVQTYAIGVGSSINQEELRIIANGGVSNERVFLADFTGLATLVAPLQTSIASFSLEGSPVTGSGLTHELTEIGFSLAYGTNITDSAFGNIDYTISLITSIAPQNFNGKRGEWKKILLRLNATSQT